MADKDESDDKPIHSSFFASKSEIEFKLAEMAYFLDRRSGVLGVLSKRYLPNYREFYEERSFSAWRPTG